MSNTKFILPALAAALISVGFAVKYLPQGPEYAGKSDAEKGTMPATAAGIYPGANADVVTGLLPIRDKCRANLDSLTRDGVVRLKIIAGATQAEYDEAVWASLVHDDKVRQATLIYCAQMPDDGHYTVLIVGLHDGHTMGSIVDGDYLD